MTGKKCLSGLRPGLMILLIPAALIRVMVIGIEPVPPDSVLYKVFAELHWPVFLTVAIMLHRSGRPFRKCIDAGIMFGLTTAVARQFFVADGMKWPIPLEEFVSVEWETAVIRAGIFIQSIVIGLAFGVASGIMASAVQKLRKTRQPRISGNVPATPDGENKMMAISDEIRKTPPPEGIRIPAKAGNLISAISKGGKIAPVLVLLVLAPWTGEFLLGSSPLGNLWGLPLILPLYGGGALLIRETVIRTGRGWPAILLLGAAYGVIEAGLIDQSLFNPAYDEYGFIHHAPVPLLGFSAVNALSFVTSHAIWSIGVPIALTGLLFPHLKQVPWLTKVGYRFAFVLYLAGCAIVFGMIYSSERFMARPDQLLFAFVTSLVLIGLAFLTKKKRRPIYARPVPRPWMIAACTFAAHSFFQLRPENWPGVAIGMIMLAVAAALASHWCRQQGWTMKHELAATAGSMLTCSWCGFVVTFIYRGDDALAWVGNALFLIMAVLLLVTAAGRINRHASEHIIHR